MARIGGFEPKEWTEKKAGFGALSSQLLAPFSPMFGKLLLLCETIYLGS